MTEKPNIPGKDIVFDMAAIIWSCGVPTEQAEKIAAMLLKKFTISHRNKGTPS
jgi:hypothetical protein